MLQLFFQTAILMSFVFTFVKSLTMPEFSIDKYCNHVSGNNKIWFSWNRFQIFSVADAFMPQKLSKFQLRLCVFTPDICHVSVSLFFSQYVHIQSDKLLSRTLIICSAIAWITGTQTELPNCLYAWVSDTGITKLSGNPCNLAASLGVSFLGLFPG